MKRAGKAELREEKKEKKQSRIGKALPDWKSRGYVLLFLAGLLLVLYPFLGSLFQSLGSRMAISAYEKKVAGAEKAELAAMLQEAREYNRTVADAGRYGSFSSQMAVVSGREEATALEENGTMAWLEIPALGVCVPIHSRGIGSGVTQIEGSSLPVGEADSHCVIADKGGWPGIRQLKKLDGLQEGDYLYLHVQGKTLAYRVDGAQVVQETESDAAAVKAGEDILTLVGSAGAFPGSERLMVSGRRTDYSYSIYQTQTGRGESGKEETRAADPDTVEKTSD